MNGLRDSYKSNIQKQYRHTVNIVGIVLMIWIAAMEILPYCNLVISDIVVFACSSEAAEIITSIVYDVVYALIFFIPVFFFFAVWGKSKPQPVRFNVRLTGDTFALIFAGIACSFGLVYVNSFIINAFELPSAMPILIEAEPYLSDSSIILNFITVAIIPAFCEELLFRGVVLSNLLPYGKATAIVASSFLFAIMHGSFHQFLYTAVGGILLGTVYVLTDSIWCSVLIHMINNSVAVFEETLWERLNGFGAGLTSYVIDSVIFLVGVLSIAYLIKKYSRTNKTVRPACRATFGRPIAMEALSETRKEIPASDVLRSFFSPFIVIFVVYALFRACYLFMG